MTTSHPRAERVMRPTVVSVPVTQERSLGAYQSGRPGNAPESGPTHPRARGLREVNMVHVPRTLTGEASVRQSGGGEGGPRTRSVQTSKPPGSDEYLEDEIPVVPTPEERRLSRIGKAELPDEEQVWDPVFSGSGHARAVGGFEV